MGDYCPLIQKKCKEHKCKFFIQIMGNNPNTGEEEEITVDLTEADDKEINESLMINGKNIVDEPDLVKIVIGL